MPFCILSAALAQSVAQPVEQYCVNRFGKSGLKIEQGIQPNLGWSPTIQIRRTKFELVAIEVSEDLYPMILKIVAHDIRQECPDIPVTVYVACPLASYLADVKQTMVRKLKEHGFGLLTVDDTGHVTEQFNAIPLIHHIAENELNDGIKSFPSSIRVKFKGAFEVYKTNSNQGLQEGGQLVEGLIFCLAKESHKKGWIPSIAGKTAAAVVDSLYEANHNDLKQARAALGKARYFIKNFRNMASHPPKNAKESAQRIKRCREGFIDSMNTASELCETLKKLKFTAKLYVP
jgi:hypothetical protein